MSYSASAKASEKKVEEKQMEKWRETNAARQKKAAREAFSSRSRNYQFIINNELNEIILKRRLGTRQGIKDKAYLLLGSYLTDRTQKYQV